MKNICFFCGNLNLTGGTERVSNNIANALSKYDFNISMLSLYMGDKPFFPLENNISHYSLFDKNVSFKKNYLTTIFKLRSFAKVKNIDILIDVESMLALFSTPALVGLKIKHITWEHFNYNVTLDRKSRVLARKLAALFSDTVVTLTQKDKECWQNRTFCKAKIVAIPNSLTFPISYSHSPKLDNKIALAMGRLTYQKGFDLLIKAWALSVKELIGWKLIIVGEGEDKGLLLALIKKYNLEDSIEIHPFTNDVTKYYQSASIFCLSSRFEGFGMVLLEAMSFGLPCISFDCDFGPSELIKNNISGYLIENGNIIEFSEKLIELSYYKDYTNLVESTKKHAEGFLIEYIIELWLDILN